MVLLHCLGENGRKAGMPPGSGPRCGNWRHNTKFCHHHTHQADNPTPWMEVVVKRCPGKYLSDTPHHHVGDPCEQHARVEYGGYCQFHGSAKVEVKDVKEQKEQKEKEGKNNICPAIKLDGKPCLAACVGPWCQVHIAKAVAAMPGEHKMTDNLREDVFKASRGECYVCRVVIRSDAFHCAHVVADVAGGLATLDNLRATCSTCNLRCGRKNLDVFKAEYVGHAPTVKEEILAEVREIMELERMLAELAARKEQKITKVAAMVKVEQVAPLTRRRRLNV